MDDDELIAALAAGDDTALRELFTRHAPWLAARLRAALPPPDVEDVLQETIRADLAAALSGPDGDVLRLMYVEDRPVAEVAALLRVPSGTVKSRAHRARRLLRVAMGGTK